MLIISGGFLVSVRHKPISGFGAREPSSQARRTRVIVRQFGEQDYQVSKTGLIGLSVPSGTERP